ncbi:MAG: ABC transporter substrate-binding protein [bacterium]
MKKLFAVFLMFFLLCFMALPSMAATKKINKIAIWSWDLNSSLLNQAYKGFLDGIEKDGLVAGKDIVIDTYDVKKDPASAATMVEQVKAGNYDAICSVGTTGSKYLLEHGVTTPVLFSVVTDPVKSGIVASLTETKNNFTGTSNKQSVEKQILSFKEVVPNVKRLGIIYKDAESNALVQVNEVNVAKEKLGFTEILTSPAKSVDELAAATEALVGKVDAIFLPADTMVGSVDAEKIIKVATAAKIPVFSANEPPTTVGALTSLCSDYFKLGTQTWGMTKQVLGGQSPQTMPVQLQDVPNIIVNLKAAEALGITVPEEFFNKVTKVIEADSK